MDLFFWLYFINSGLLIVHEMDSAYWREWELFKLPGGISGFLLLHIPLVFLLLFGLIQVYKKDFSGLIFALVLGISGIAAFTIHSHFLRKGRPEFGTVVSRMVLAAILMISIVQTLAAVFYIFLD